MSVSRAAGHVAPPQHVGSVAVAVSLSQPPRPAPVASGEPVKSLAERVVDAVADGINPVVLAAAAMTHDPRVRGIGVALGSLPHAVDLYRELRDLHAQWKNPPETEEGRAATGSAAGANEATWARAATLLASVVGDVVWGVGALNGGVGAQKGETDAMKAGWYLAAAGIAVSGVATAVDRLVAPGEVNDGAVSSVTDTLPYPFLVSAALMGDDRETRALGIASISAAGVRQMATAHTPAQVASGALTASGAMLWAAGSLKRVGAVSAGGLGLLTLAAAAKVLPLSWQQSRMPQDLEAGTASPTAPATQCVTARVRSR
ncbi:hypothetical protein ACFV2D_34565 [Streptomyces capillispiralis]|uniref:hypothetical protein n=1 Tax=Streptomyces capillispiralis TaxID=68182 RepID=UPI0036A69E66